MTITHEFTVDLKQEKVQVIKVPQYNKDTHILNITLADDGIPVSLSSTDYNAYLKVAGAAGNFYNLPMSIINGIVTITLPESLTAIPGRHNSQVDIIQTSAGTRLCSMPFYILILNSVYSDEEVIASNEYTSLTELLVTAQELMNRITAKLVQIDSMYTQMYKYKGSVPSEASLPVRNVEVGDVYNTEDTGMNYAWTGTEWDALGQLNNVNLWTKDEMEMITSQEIDNMFTDE